MSDYSVNDILNLSKNKIEKIPNDYFAKKYKDNINIISKVKTIDLSQNKIIIIENEAFAIFESLKSLILSNNKLSSISFLSCKNLVNLEILDLANNNLDDKILPITIKLPYLTTLKLNDNNIRNFEILNLNHFTELEILEVDFTKIKEINSFFYNNLPLKYQVYY